MTCTYGGLPCLDPAQELANCQALGYPTPWAGVANSFTCLQGIDYGRGRVLMFRGDLLSLNLNAFYPLVFSDGTRSVTLKQVLFVRAYCATPGGRGDPTEAYWCELADKRLLCHQPIDRAYNVRSTPGGAYYSATLNSGTPWTWAGMTADIWFTVNKLSGTFPGLPFTPNGTPEGWAFWGSDAFDALGSVLDRLGCALDYNPIADTFSIVRLGVADTTAAAALTAVDPACVWDSDPIEGTKAAVPGVLRVFFLNQRDAADTTGASPFTARDVTDPTAGGPLPGADPNRVAILYDDLPAIYAGGVLSNSAALTARAAERGADYYRRARQGRLYRGYTGGYGLPGLLPGAQLTATIWRDTGAGLFTEVVRLPGPLAGDPFAGLAGATPGGGSLPGEPGQGGAPGTGGAPGATGPGGSGTTALLPPIFVGGAPLIASLPPWLFNFNYLYQILYNSFSVSLGGGGGGSGITGIDLIKGTTDLGPQPNLELIDGGGVTISIGEDNVTQRVQATFTNTCCVEVKNLGGAVDETHVTLIQIGDGLTLTSLGAGAVNLEGDGKVWISSGDTTPNYLQPKLVAGAGITITKQNPSGNENLKIAVDMSANGGSSATIGSGTTGTTVASPGAVIFDLTNGDGIIAGVAIRNTGFTNGLSYNLFVKDLYGNTGTGATVTVPIQTTVNFNTFTDLIGTVKYPYQELKLTIQDQTAGNHTTYDVKLTRTS